MITFAGGQIDLDTFNHENMHQWWGDNVSEASYNLTFFKEGMATLGEYLLAARNAETAAGGPGTAGRARGVRATAWSAQFNNDLRQRPAASGRPRRPTRRRSACSPTPPPTRGPAPPTSRCGRSSARPTSPGRCSRSSATTAAASITEAAARGRRSTHWLPNQSAACSSPARASSSRSGSTPPTRRGGGANRPADHRARAGRAGLLRRQRRLPRVAAPRPCRPSRAPGAGSTVSDSIGPLNQCPRGQRILALSSAPSVELIR